MTGLSLDTLRAWERRYQAVSPEHTERGREYKPEQIERLMLLNRLNQKGHSIGRIASLTDDELNRLLAESPPEVTPLAALTGPVMKAIETFDSARAADELGRLAAILTPRELVYQVAVPLMAETGSRWHQGYLAIAQEHLVSQLLRNLLGGMMRHFRPHSGSVKMLLATPQGETHEFGILAAAMLASLAGLETVYLGADLPASEIAGAARHTGARIISMGVTIGSDAVARELQLLAQSLPDDAELWVGGSPAALATLEGMPRVIFVKDFPAFENECRRWGN